MHQQSIGTAAQSRSQAHQHVTQVPRFAQRFDDVTQAIHATLHDAQLQIVPNLFRVNAGVDLFDVYLGQFDPADRARLVAVFDDRSSVVTMWREHGVTCFQVAPGDF